MPGVVTATLTHTQPGTCLTSQGYGVSIWDNVFTPLAGQHSYKIDQQVVPFLLQKLNLLMYTFTATSCSLGWALSN